MPRISSPDDFGSIVINILIVAAGADGHHPSVEAGRGPPALVRLTVQAEAVDLPQRSSEDRALDTAADAARKAGVRTHSRLLDDCSDLVIAMGLGALSSFVVNGWPDMYVTLGTYAASKKENLGERAMRGAFENPRRLKQLADGVPGRITAPQMTG